MCYKQYFEELYQTIVVESTSTEPAITETKEPVIPPDRQCNKPSGIPLSFHGAKPSIKIF